MEVTTICTESQHIFGSKKMLAWEFIKVNICYIPLLNIVQSRSTLDIQMSIASENLLIVALVN